MPRKFQLTWQSGTNGREGRWRKKYKGKAYYYPGGRGKYDREAYEAALAAWAADKIRLDANAPRPHQQQYDAAIAEWEQVLAWSSRHADQNTAAVAFEKLKTLRTGLAAPLLQPLRPSDWFADYITIPTIPLRDD